ncbi:Myogenesis-regulating glycosidase [Chionoecetes opilio]|uniref:Myogenesis-regulating glycosidase n=1 Tax=Chionoecetes opilio TaxID=41210 RepID=A0A8J4XUY7_CHIOP|nr:Myogenesis-regulating glycosidase [Chionoecetes opilio]
MLVVIVVSICLVSYFYHLHLLELSIFNRFRFYEKTRFLEVYDAAWKPVVTLHMGTRLPVHSIPEDCTDYLGYLDKKNSSVPHLGLDDDQYEEMTCLDWTGLAQLHLRKLYSGGSVQCYSVWWLAHNKDFTLRDCLMPTSMDQKERNFTWWGGGEMATGGFPVTRANIPPETMVTGKLDRGPWGQVLRRTWLSDSATLLILPPVFRGRVSVNHEQDEQVCLEVHVTPCPNSDPTLSYTLCTAPDRTTLADYLHQRTVRERRVVGLAAPSLVNYTVEGAEQDANESETQDMTGLQETFAQEVVTRVEDRLKNPVWIPWMTPDSPTLTQAGVLRYVDRVVTNATGMLGHIVLPASWQTRPGELEFDPDRFPDPLALSEALKAKRFHLALTLHPFVSVDVPDFNKGASVGLWVRQRDSVLPALAHYDERHPCVVTDFSNPRASQWYASKLEQLKEKYGIDRFHLQPADGHALPAYHDHHTPMPGSDNTLVHFMASVSSVSPPVSTETAVMPPLPPTFVTMGSGDGSWRGMETLVPRVLTLAMLGFPFIDVGPVGGIARAGHVPERELYIRWIEASAFLPAMQMSVLPSTYDQEVEDIAEEYLALRKQLVLPRLMQKVQEALDYGTPLITPLALFLPDDPEAKQVDDQWMLGDDLMVAPVTRRGARTRTLYLPKGIWREGIEGNLRNGGRWVRDYKVPINKIPYFILTYVNDFET